jgi:uncharacterized protein YkwD
VPRGARTILVGAALVAAVAAAPALAVGERTASGHAGALTSQRALEQGVLQEINDLRRQHGLVALRLAAPLSAAARQHSQSMALEGYFAHESSDGSPFWKRLRRFYSPTGYGYWSVGENLLYASPDVDPHAALQLWLTSPKHRENMLTARWREIGLSAVHSEAAPGVFGGAPATVLTADFGVRR